MLVSGLLAALSGAAAPVDVGPLRDPQPGQAERAEHDRALGRVLFRGQHADLTDHAARQGDLEGHVLGPGIVGCGLAVEGELDADALPGRILASLDRFDLGRFNLYFLGLARRQVDDP